MDIKTALLNGDLHENVYMTQLEGFVVDDKEHMSCKHKKSLYRLKQLSSQWYIKLDEVIRNFGFSENKVNNYIYIKFKGKDFTIIVLLC
jgi:hypothetical protein